MQPSRECKGTGKGGLFLDSRSKVKSCLAMPRARIPSKWEGTEMILWNGGQMLQPAVKSHWYHKKQQWAKNYAGKKQVKRSAGYSVPATDETIWRAKFCCCQANQRLWVLPNGVPKFYPCSKDYKSSAKTISPTKMKLLKFSEIMSLTKCSKNLIPGRS